MTNAVNGNEAFRNGLITISITPLMYLLTYLKLTELISNVLYQPLLLIMFLVFIYFGSKTISSSIKALRSNEDWSAKSIFGIFIGLMIVIIVALFIVQFFKDIAIFM